MLHGDVVHVEYNSLQNYADLDEKYNKWHLCW